VRGLTKVKNNENQKKEIGIVWNGWAVEEARGSGGETEHFG